MMKLIWNPSSMVVGAAERITAWPCVRSGASFSVAGDRSFGPARSPRAGTRGDPTPRRLLIADDDAILREIYRAALSSEGVLITSSGDGRSALEETRRRDFDLLLLDLRMPGIGGLELLRRLRRNMDLTPAIISTGELDVRAFLCGVRHGVVTFLRKPLAITTLRRTVHEHLTRFAGCRFGAVFRELGKRRFREAAELIDRDLGERERGNRPLLLWRNLCRGIAQGRDDRELEPVAREILLLELTVPFEI